LRVYSSALPASLSYGWQKTLRLFPNSRKAVVGSPLEHSEEESGLSLTFCMASKR